MPTSHKNELFLDIKKRFEVVEQELQSIHRSIDLGQMHALQAAKREKIFALIRPALLRSEALCRQIRKDQLLPLGHLNAGDDIEDRMYPDR